MVKVQPKGSQNPPEFRSVPCGLINYYRWLGWFLICDSRDLELDDVRREDESRGRPNG